MIDVSGVQRRERLSELERHIVQLHVKESAAVLCERAPSEIRHDVVGLFRDQVG